MGGKVRFWGDPMDRRRRVAIIFGGPSNEHEVSVASARSVLAAIDRDRFEAVPVAIARSGAWLTPAETRAALARTEGQDLATIQVEGEGLLARPEVLALLREVDIAFPVLHGAGGEDGAIQGLFELAGVPYVGAGVTASAIGMDKSVQKALWRQAGLPVARSLTLSRAECARDPAAAARRIEREFDYPVFVKPVNSGSSVGVSKVRSREDLADAFVEAGRWDRRLLVEEAVPGREIECAVLGNDDPQASPLGEIVPAAEFYTYAAKYLDDATRLIAPAELPEALAAEFRRLAIAAYRAIDCAGMARVDFFLTPEGRPVLNEINTIPGFTRISMYPRLWQLAGLSYPELITRLIELGLERHAETHRA
jgi:D-alanine-D-alanine ligase